LKSFPSLLSVNYHFLFAEFFNEDVGVRRLRKILERGNIPPPRGVKRNEDWVRSLRRDREGCGRVGDVVIMFIWKY
jgi:hypothetical protein